MEYLELNNKKLPVPSFFQVYNFGGGNGDKDREIVYANLTADTPALLNYYYICNKYPHTFQSKLFDDWERYNTVGDLYNHIRTKLIEKGEIYSDYSAPRYDFNTKVFLLDSGAFNIIKAIAKDVGYDIDKFNKQIIQDVKEYYDYAHALKFDIVVGFDFGGKYTEKDGEKKNKELVDFLSKIDIDELNRRLLKCTIEYLSNHPNYYPKVLATVHGKTIEEYKSNVLEILELEKTYNQSFWGFALGGIASYKQVDKSWYEDINLTDIGKRGFVETIPPARACKIVKSIIGKRPIHALGCGGYNNIVLNYYCGATSFDAASTARRVGDGNLESTKIVFNPTPSSEGFSKYFVGGINFDNSLRTEIPRYIKLNEVPDDMPLCGCNACRLAKNIHNIKYLYSIKETDLEANYFSRQLIGLHAVMQHRKLCEIISNYSTMNDFVSHYNNSLFLGLDFIFSKL